MEKLRLVRPQRKHEKQAMMYFEEIREQDTEFHGMGGLEAYHDNYDGWLEKLAADRVQAINAEQVPMETFFLVRREMVPIDGSNLICDGWHSGGAKFLKAIDKIIGMVNIRLALNDALWEEDGNIGYSIRPSERGKGYAKLQLYLALKVCQQYGLEVVFLDCAEENVASAKTIRALGGRLARTRSVPHYTIPHKYVNIAYFVIDVEVALSKYADRYNQFISEHFD